MKKKTFTLGMALLLCLSLFPMQALAYNKDEDVKVRRVEINMSRMQVSVNQSRRLLAYIYPTNATDQVVGWESSNPEVAEVDGDGVVTGISPGLTAITCIAGDDKKDTCIVTVRGSARDDELDIPNKEIASSVFFSGETVNAQPLKSLIETTSAKYRGQGVVPVVMQDKTSISAEALSAAADMAKSQKQKIILKFISYDYRNRYVQGQLNIDPSQAPYTAIKTGIATSEDDVVVVREKLSRQFDTHVAVIRCAQKGSYGMTVDISAKVDLGSMNTDKLAFYSFDTDSNTYTKLSTPNYRVDEHGYVHFSTQVGGYLFIIQQDAGSNIQR